MFYNFYIHLLLPNNALLHSTRLNQQFYLPSKYTELQMLITAFTIARKVNYECMILMWKFCMCWFGYAAGKDRDGVPGISDIYFAQNSIHKSHKQKTN